MPFVFATLLILAPLYVWRFSVDIAGGILPTNFLMLASFVVIGIGIIEFLRHGSFTNSLKELQESVLSLGKPFVVGLILVKIACLISLLAFGITGEKLAQLVVLYFQPLVIFLLIRYFSQKDSQILQRVIQGVYWILFAAGALALVQYFTLWTLPEAWWGNSAEPKRAIAFFAHANAYALFATPLLAWLIPDVVKRAQAFWAAINRSGWDLIFVVAWLVGLFGLFFTLSRGAWMALLAAAAVYVLLSANKKMFIFFCGVLIVTGIVVAAVPNLRYRVILPFYGEKSAVARLSLWQTGQKMLTDQIPQSVILGKGVNGFSDNWDKFNTDAGLEHYNFPHNIFLNFWIDLGLLGLAGMVVVMAVAVWRGIVNRKNPVALGLLLFVVAIVVHGLIDIPYLKNDLALVFWMIFALGL